jgi:hypothetical protein
MPPMHRKLLLIYPNTTTDESISLTNLHSVQRCQHKVNSAKDAVLFHNISAKILLHILSKSFQMECHILLHFCQIRLPFKST